MKLTIVPRETKLIKKPSPYRLLRVPIPQHANYAQDKKSSPITHALNIHAMNEYSDIVSWETRNRSGYLPKFHGFATRMLFDTKTIGGIYTVSKLLGHSRVATTEMYLHCSQKQLEQAMLADPLGAGV